jgi:hypothetical protein
LQWFADFNSEREYPDTVKPFNFLIALQARPQFELPTDQQQAVRKRGRPRKHSEIKPVAPFTSDIRAAAQTAFDRDAGISISADQLMTYAEALAQYHLRPEAKFLNGDFSDRGRTERRHVFATQILHVGKEANKWEEQYFLGADDDAEIEYGVRSTQRRTRRLPPRALPQTRRARDRPKPRDLPDNGAPSHQARR